MATPILGTRGVKMQRTSANKILYTVMSITRKMITIIMMILITMRTRKRTSMKRKRINMNGLD
jgi:hypothetical protein